MSVMGLSLAEWAALVSVLSLLFAGMTRFYHQFRRTISAPLIEAVDKLRQEISQLERYLMKEHDELKQKNEQLDLRLRLQEERSGKKGKGYDDYRLADRS